MERSEAERPWPERRVCLAAVAGAQGVRGLVKLKTFTERPEDALAYGALQDEFGERIFRMTAKGRSKGLLVAAIEGVADRDAAAALRGTRLYVDRAVLPPTEEEEYYHADLLGLEVRNREGLTLGRVRAIYDFGAGDVIEVRGEDGRISVLPFTRQVVPEVDLAGGRLVADPPAETLAGAPEETPEETRGETRGETPGETPEGTGQSRGKAP